MRKRRSWMTAPLMLAAMSFGSATIRSASVLPSAYSGGWPSPFYGNGKRTHRSHRLTAAQRYHHASGKS